MRARFGLFAGLWLLAVQAFCDEGVRWAPSLESAKQIAGQSNQLVLIHFWAPYCSYCRKMEQEILPQPEVAATIRANYVPVKLNAEYFPSIVRDYGVTKLPTEVVITPQGQLLQKIEGMPRSQEYLAQLNQIAATARQQSPSVLAQMSAGAAPGAVPPQTPAAGPDPRSAQVALGDSRYADYYRQHGAYSAQPGPPAQTPPAQDSAPPGAVVQNVMPQGPAMPGPTLQGEPMMGAPAATGPSAPAIPSVANAAAPPAGPAGVQMPAYGRDATIPGPNVGAPAGPAGAQMPAFGRNAMLSPNAAAPVGPAPTQTPAPSIPNIANATPPVDPNPGYAGIAGQATSQRTASRAGLQPSPGAEQTAVAAQGPRANANQPATVGSDRPSAAAPRSIQLPPGSPPLCLDGYCPVQLVENHRYVPGDVRWGAIHLGRTYLFAGPDEQRRFLAANNAELYAPVFSGMDVVLAIERHEQVLGSMRHGGYFGNRVYLFSSEETLKKFSEKPEFYVQAMRSGNNANNLPYQR